MKHGRYADSESYASIDAKAARELDVDVFREYPFVPDSNELWDEFEALHELKNRCFFESLEPAMVERDR